VRTRQWRHLMKFPMTRLPKLWLDLGSGTCCNGATGNVLLSSGETAWQISPERQFVLVRYTHQTAGIIIYARSRGENWYVELVDAYALVVDSEPSISKVIGMYYVVSSMAFAGRVRLL